MSIYFQTRPACVPAAASSTSGAAKSIPIKGTSCAHLVEPLFALASNPGGRVVVCNEEGDTVHEIATSAAAPTAMTFHPTRQILAIGHRNGSFLITSCSQSGSVRVGGAGSGDGPGSPAKAGNNSSNNVIAGAFAEMKEHPPIHQNSAIAAVSFGSSTDAAAGGAVSAPTAAAAAPGLPRRDSVGGRGGGISSSAGASFSTASSSATGFDTVYFVTADKVLSAWTIGDGNLTALWNTKTPSAVTSITRGDGFLFMHAPTSPNIVVIDEAQQNCSVGTALGKSGGGPDLGHPVRTVWDAKARSLVALTTTAHLLSYKIGFDGRMSQTAHRKLLASAISDTNVLQLALVAPGVVAVGAGDSTIRIIAYGPASSSSSSSSALAAAASATLFSGESSQANALEGSVNAASQQQQQQTGPSNAGRTSTLYFPETGAAVSTASAALQVVTSLASARQKLVASNRAGQVVIWQFLGSGDPSVGSTSATNNISSKADKQQDGGDGATAGAASSSPLGLDEWQVLSQTTGSGGADAIGSVDRVVISSSPNGSVLVAGADGYSLLQGTVRQRRWHSKAMALQVSPTQVVVQNTSGVNFQVNVNQSIGAKMPKGGAPASTSTPTAAAAPGGGAGAEVMRVRGVDIFLPNVLLWTGKTVEVFSLMEGSGGVSPLGSYEQTLPAVALYADGLLLSSKDRVTMTTFSKHANYSLTASESEGAPQVISVAEDVGAVVTHKGSLKVFRIGQRDLKTVGPSRQLRTPQGQPVNNIQLMSINRSGKKVAFTTAMCVSVSSGGGVVSTTVDLSSSVFVYDVDTDSVHQFTFTDRLPTYLAWNMSPAQLGGGIGLNAQTSGPDAEAMLLACETRVVRFRSSSSSSSSSAAADGASLHQDLSAQHNASGAGVGFGGTATDRHVTTLFSSPKGVHFHHTIPLRVEQCGLIGCTVPHLVLGVQLEAELDGDPDEEDDALAGSAIGGYEHSMYLKHLRDFEGMHQAETDAKLREALMNFAYYAAIGNMDDAYKSVKMVKDPGIWVNMAKMCVSTRRIDVAEVCLSNMQDTVAAKAVRETRGEESLDVRIATLAMTLGMNDEAEALLRKCKRYDLLTELFIACGKWDAAVSNCESHDRLRTASVFFRQAQMAESAGSMDGALTLYGRAKCLGTEYPRILFAANRIDELQAKVQGSDDRDLLSWWAQYLESTGDANGALDYYKRANDGFNAVRLLVDVHKKVEAAEDLLRDPSVPSGAAFFVARHYEKKAIVEGGAAAATIATSGAPIKKNSKESSSSSTSSSVANSLLLKAVQMYEKAAAFENAIRLAKDQDMHADVLRISLKSGNTHTALESGRYFEERGMFDKAVQLYRQGGDSQRAIDVCIRGGLFDELHRISESIEAGADPETFIAMASHFSANGHYSKAVEMLVFGKAFNEALQLCLDRGVKLTDQMAEAMTLPKGGNAEDEEYRLNLLRKIAKVAKDQESYHLACKKYTQCGEVMKAMKALLKSGDTEKIIFFANHIRNAEVYQATANFLQSTNWKNDQGIFKSVVACYIKAKNFESLSLFYETAAQMQINDNRSYEKAAGLLREGMKALEKGDGTENAVAPHKKANLARRIEAVDGLLRAVSANAMGNGAEFVTVCTDLLDRSRPPHPDSDNIKEAIRVGDVYALLVEFYAASQQNDKAYSTLQQMQRDGIHIQLFVEAALQAKILAAVGADPNTFQPKGADQRRMSTGGPGPAVAANRRPAQDDVADDVEEDV